MKECLRERLHDAGIVTGLLLLASSVSATGSIAEEWQLYKPSNTGIPGGVVEFCELDPENNLWVAARDPFWEEGGIAMFDRVKWTTYSNLDSPLPTDRVFAADFLADGTTWLGTDIGVVRFDRFTGSDWSVFTPDNSPLPGEVIFSLDLDRLGRLWMVYRRPGTMTRGVAMFDGANWTAWSPEEIGFGLVELDDVAVDAENNVWVGTRYSGGLAMFDGFTWRVFNGQSGYSDYPARHLTLGGDGHLWVYWEGLKMFDGINWIPKPELPDEISVITALSDGTYWLGTYSGIIGYYDNVSWTLYEYGIGSHVYSIEVDPAEEVWCAGLAHLRRLGASGTFRTYNNRNTGLTEYFVNDFGFEAQDGRVWFATGGGGVCSFDGEIWRGFNPDNDGFEPWPFDSNGAEQVDVAPNGDVWVNAVVAVGQWDGEAWAQHIPGYWIEEMTVDAAGNVWVAPYGDGIGKYDGIGWQAVTTPAYYDPVFLEAGPDGRIWMGVSTGVMVLDGEEWTVYTPVNSGLPSMVAFDVAFHPDGSVWIATYEGLARFDGIEWTVYTEANSGLRVNTVLSVAVREDGLVAAGAFRGDIWPYIGGVSTFDGAEWVTYTVSNSPLQHEQVESLEFDHLGRLWISSMTEGVARVTMPSTTDAVTMDPAPAAAWLRSSSQPNPFSTSTEIRFNLPETAQARLTLYDASGRRVESLLDRRLPRGEHVFTFDGRNLRSGVYFYRLQADGRCSSGKLVVQR